MILADIDAKSADRRLTDSQGHLRAALHARP
jgi:N-acetylmuramic acid 6-phosphate etherase